MWWLTVLGAVLLCVQFVMTLGASTKMWLNLVGAALVVAGVTKQYGLW